MSSTSKARWDEGKGTRIKEHLNGYAFDTKLQKARGELHEGKAIDTTARMTKPWQS